MLRYILLFLAMLPGICSPILAQDELNATDQRVLRELEEKVTQAKKDVHEAKIELRQLEEAVLRGKITGSKAIIMFDNQADGFFALASAEFALDGEPIFKVNAEDKKKPFAMAKVFDGDLPSGEHTIDVTLEYRGSDKSIYTAFAYFKDHKFVLKSKETFAVEYGKTVQVKVVALDKGYFKNELEERLALKVQTVPDWGREPPE